MAWVVAAGSAALVVAMLLTVVQAGHVRAALDNAGFEVTLMKRSVQEGDAEAAREHLLRARQNAASARQNTRGPIWWTASKLPWIGDDVTAVRTIAEVADDWTGEPMEDLVVAGSQLSGDDLVPSRGFADALVGTLVGVIGLLALTFLVTFLLPMRARPEE